MTDLRQFHFRNVFHSPGQISQHVMALKNFFLSQRFTFIFYQNTFASLQNPDTKSYISNQRMPRGLQKPEGNLQIADPDGTGRVLALSGSSDALGRRSKLADLAEDCWPTFLDTSRLPCPPDISSLLDSPAPHHPNPSSPAPQHLDPSSPAPQHPDASSPDPSS